MSHDTHHATLEHEHPARRDGPRARFPVRPGLTLWFGSTLLVWQLAQIARYLEGARSWGMLLLLVMPAQYLMCVCIHDAVHGVMTRGRSRNTLAGMVLAMGVMLPFPLLRRAHLRHHGALYQEDDPERVVYNTPASRLLWRLPVIPWIYLQNWRLLRGEERALTVVAIAGIVAIAAAIAARWGLEALALGWVAPSLLTIAWFGFTTVWVPHSRHRDRLMRYFTEHSGWHDDHHRAPQYPFNQYVQLRAFHLRHGVFTPRGAESRVIHTLAAPVLPRHHEPGHDDVASLDGAHAAADALDVISDHRAPGARHARGVM